MKRLYLLLVILLVASMAITTVSCKKGQATTETAQGEATLARIMNFKQQVDYYKANPAIKDGESVTLDEAIWNIEALFNLTYAKPEDAYSETTGFLFSLYLPVNTHGRVLVSDLCYLYEQVKSMARTYYANLDYTDKGFLFMTVELGEQIDGFVRIDFRGKAGERCAQNIVNVNPHDSIMYIGPFRQEDDWNYKRGNGKCDGSYAYSGADDQLEIHLQEYISSLLRVSDAGCRPVYLNHCEIIFDGRSAPSYAFYREDVNATCIDNNSMNHLWQREKSYIVTILPSIQPSLYGYVPVEITIQGVELVNPSAISHENRVVYTQRIMAIVSAVGEIQDLLDE